jgi:hypothetical protein
MDILHFALMVTYSPEIWHLVEELIHPHSANAIPGILSAVVATGLVAVLAPAAASAMIPAADAAPSASDAPADGPAQEAEVKMRRLETAVMPEGVRAVAVGAEAPVWVYARMQTFSSPTLGYQPDADLTKGITFRVVDGDASVVLGEKRTIGSDEWVAVGVTVPRRVDGAPPPRTVRIVAERFTITGTLYHRRTVTLQVIDAR